MEASTHSTAEPSSSGPASTAFALSIIVAALAGLVLLIKGLYPADLPLTKNPNFIDNIFDNRAVIWAARLLLVSAAAVLAFGGVFIVISVGIRMKTKNGCGAQGLSRSPRPPSAKSKAKCRFGAKSHWRARRRQRN